MSNNYGLARKYPTEVVPLDRRTQQSVVCHANKMVAIGEVTRTAMNEMSTNYVTAQMLMAQALTTAGQLASQVPETEMAQAFFKVLSQQYMQRMINLNNTASEKISQRLHRYDENYGSY